SYNFKNPGCVAFACMHVTCFECFYSSEYDGSTLSLLRCKFCNKPIDRNRDRQVPYLNDLINSMDPEFLCVTCKKFHPIRTISRILVVWPLRACTLLASNAFIPLNTMAPLYLCCDANSAINRSIEIATVKFLISMV
ncbi:hypothetical protein PFISCL1PPCAC_14724, partial [Pristionchus fissidentatus]